MKIYSMLLALFAALFCFLGISSAVAQSQRSTVRFTIIALSELPDKHLYYRDGMGFVEIEIKNGKRSNPYSLASAQFLEIYTDHEDPEQRYRLIGKARLVAGTSRMLYFLRENSSIIKEGTLPLGLFGVDDSHATFPDGSFQFINFINAPLVIEFNKKRFDMKPGQSAVRKLNLPEAGAFIPFIVKDSQERILGGTRLFSHAANREMVLIFPPKQGKKRLDIRYFSD